MKIADKRFQFKISLVTEDTMLLEAESGASEQGFNIEVFSSFADFYTEIPSNPPHVVVVDSRAVPKSGDINLNSIVNVSPETIVLVVVDGVDEGLAYEGVCYDFLLRPFVRAKTLTVALDRACEKVFNTFKIEQLVEKLRESGFEEGAVSAQTTNQLSEMSSVPILDTTSTSSLFFKMNEKLKKSEGPRASLQIFMETFHDNVEQVPLLFFKYVSQPPSLMAMQGVGVEMKEVTGVGCHLNESFFSSEELRKSAEASSDLGELLKKAFGVEEFQAYGLQLDKNGFGLLVVLGQFEAVQANDLFVSLLQTLKVNLDNQKTSYELQKLQIYSPVTGLLNREAFCERVTDEVARSRRIQQPVSSIALSIDGFEEYSRRAGKALAEKVLAGVGDIFAQTSRANDIVADFGGGDFVILLPHTDQKGAAIKAEKLRRIVESSNFPKESIVGQRGLTLSLGVSEYPGASRDAESFLLSADDALYFIKKQGGNQVCMASPVKEFRPDFEERNQL